MFYYIKIWRIREFLKNLVLKKEVSIRNNIDFGNNKTNSYFFKKLKLSNFYFEYGSGASSILATKLRKKFVSIETDFKFYNLMLNKIDNKNIKFFSIGPTIIYSYPIFILKKKIKKYVKSIDLYFKKNKKIDLILIDGRFRVACCLNLLNFKNAIIKKKINILLDDYLLRKHYHILNKYYKIKSLGRMAILQPKRKDFKINYLLKKYLNDPR